MEIFLIVLVAVIFLCIVSCLKIVPQGYEYTVETFGKFSKILRPGIHGLIPIAERIGERVNMMEQVLDIPSQDVITKDNAMVRVDGVVFFEIQDAYAASYQIHDLYSGLLNLVMTNVRTVIGSMEIDESIRFNGTESDFWQIQTDYSKRIAESELKPFEVFSAGDGTEEVSCVIAVFAEDTLVELTNAERFTADNSEYETEVVFFANYGDVYDFEFCEIKWLDDSDGGESDIEFVPVYKTETLTQDTPLVVTMTFWGDIPSYGIRYTDSEGAEHSGTISTSGMDGSLILDVI